MKVPSTNQKSAKCTDEHNIKNTITITTQQHCHNQYPGIDNKWTYLSPPLIWKKKWDEYLYILFLTERNWKREPEGSDWNRDWRGWVLTNRVEFAFWETYLLYRSARLLCWAPVILPLTFTVLECSFGLDTEITIAADHRKCQNRLDVGFIKHHGSIHSEFCHFMEAEEMLPAFFADLFCLNSSSSYCP